MPRLPLLILALLPGCSNAPLAGTLDTIFPSRLRPVPPDLNRERDREFDRPADPIRPLDRPALPPVEPYPYDDPRRGDRERSRPGEPLRRTAEPAPRGRDSDLPLLAPPGGLDDLLPPPGSR